MTRTKLSLATLLAIGMTTGVIAQQPAPKPAAAASGFQPKISAAAAKELTALQTAVVAKDSANIPALLAAAKAKVKTKDDQYALGNLQLRAALITSNYDEAMAGVDVMAASGAVPAGQMNELYTSLGMQFHNAKQHDKAVAAYERVLANDPANSAVTIEIARTRIGQGKRAEAQASLNKAIALRTAAGQKPDESWYKVAVSNAYNGKLPGLDDTTRAWLVAYPTKDNWNEVLRVYLNSHNLNPSAGVDVSRLMFAAGAMKSENDYYRLATALTSATPGEAKAVLDQGIAAGIVKKDSDVVGPLYAMAASKSQGDRASLEASSKAALAQPAASKIVRNADAYYGYGDYAKAADLYRAALGKTGADANLINLRLGMSLARAGDKAGAATALNAAGGSQAGIAKLWLQYLTMGA